MLLLNDHLEAPQLLTLGSGEAVVFTRPAADGAVNQDCLAVFDLPDASVIAVADGVGGGPRGGDAARIAIEAIVRHLQGAEARTGLRAPIHDAFEAAQREILELAAGAATTLVVAEVSGGSVRTYHTGDSGAFLTGRGGKVKLKTVFHSPSGYAEESGLLTEADALMHTDRHYVSNLLGTTQMSVEISAPMPMARFDTLVLGSDGLFDNLAIGEIVDVVRSGRLLVVGERLLRQVSARMDGEALDAPSKSDDLSFVLFRRRV